MKKKIEIHQLDFAPVIAEFKANEKQAVISLRFLNAELLREDNNTPNSAANLLRRNFYYMSFLEKGKKRFLVDLAGDRIKNDSEFIERIYECDSAKHADYKFRNIYGKDQITSGRPNFRYKK